MPQIFNSYIFLMLTAISALFFIFLLWLRSGQKKVEALPASSDFTPKVSVVVAARNEEDTLAGLLDNLMEQTYPDEAFEIVLVNDNSIDRTAEIIESYKERLPNLRMVNLDALPAGWAGKKWAVSQGIKHAEGEIILLTDADCLPPPTWIATIIQPFTDENVAVVAAPTPLEKHPRTLLSEMLMLDSLALEALNVGGVGQGLTITACGRNMAYRKQIFEDVDGYAGLENLFCGDDDLLMQKMVALGHGRLAVNPNPDCLVPSPPPPDLKTFVSQRLRFASPGLRYFKLPTTFAFIPIVIIMAIANMVGLLSLIATVATGSLIWLIPLILKILGEWGLVYPYLRRIGRPVRLATFWLTGLLYPLYIAGFGIMGRFVSVEWKGRPSDGELVGDKYHQAG